MEAEREQRSKWEEMKKDFNEMGGITLEEAESQQEQRIPRNRNVKGHTGQENYSSISTSRKCRLKQATWLSHYLKTKWRTEEIIFMARFRCGNKEKIDFGKKKKHVLRNVQRKRILKPLR